jgi:hypothetical protein
MTAIVCAARAFTIEHAFSACQIIEFQLDGRSRHPAPPVIPLLEISHDGSKRLNMDRYMSITIPYDTNHFNSWFQHDIMAISTHSPVEYG